MIHCSGFVWTRQGESLDTVPRGTQQQMTQLWEAEWESGELYQSGPLPCQYSLKADMKMKWHLPGIF